MALTGSAPPFDIRRHPLQVLMFSVLNSIAPRWRGQRLHRPRLANRDEWAALAARHGHQTSARSETVKFVVDLLDSARTYFFDSKRWETHYRFVQRFIDPRLDQDHFVRLEYTRKNRRFLLGSVLHYLDGDHWTLELSSCDTMAIDQIAWLFEHVKHRIGFECDLRFKPVSPGQIAAVEAAGHRLAVLPRDALNAAVLYQPLVLGVAYGWLRIIRGEFDVAAVRPFDVVVIDEVPNEIPPIAALVTSQLQAPLMHVAVLSRNRNTPDMAYRGAIDLPAFKELEGEIVKLTVAGQDFTIERADPVQAQAAWTAMRPAKALAPICDLSVTTLCNVEALPEGAARYFGAKAAQVGTLGRIEGIVTPGGFVLPFSAYRAHLESAGLVAPIDAMLNDEGFRRSAKRRAERLAVLRACILSHPVEPRLLSQVEERVRAVDGHRHWIYRSSSNAEDLAGFNGAGLYESTVVPTNASGEQIADGLRMVWASVWLQRAFEEREWYRIDHLCVAMAVLVQPFFDDAVASGVAITGNPFQRGSEAVFINTQVRGHSVTGAAGNELPEQVLVTTWTGDYEFELLSRSSLANGASILAETDLRRLTDQLFKIHSRMLPLSAAPANAMDVEFILTAQRQFVMVQARPHTIVHNVDRALPNLSERLLPTLMRIVRRVAFRFLPNRLSYRSGD